MKIIGDYHNHWLKKDVLLLADAFEKFTSTCFIVYKLDPCHYFSSPVFSWDPILKMAEWFSEAYNKDMKNSDPRKWSKHITTYLDENNLYGWAMSGYLPYGRFQWLKDVFNFNVNLIN